MRLLLLIMVVRLGLVLKLGCVPEELLVVLVLPWLRLAGMLLGALSLPKETLLRFRSIVFCFSENVIAVLPILRYIHACHVYGRSAFRDLLILALLCVAFVFFLFLRFLNFLSWFSIPLLTWLLFPLYHSLLGLNIILTRSVFFSINYKRYVCASVWYWLTHIVAK